MKRSLGILLSMLVAGVVGFSQVGCSVRYVSYREPAPPLYPYAYRIQGRAYNQIDRIENAIRLGNLDSRVGDALADNDDSVLELVRYYQESSYPYRDITAREALFLDGMLDDNTVLVDDAIRRRHVWNSYFSGSYSYNFNASFDRRIYVVYSSYQLKCQQRDIETACNSGHLSASQAEELRDRVRYIRNQRLDACRQNGQWKMDGAQVGQVRQLTEDNSRMFKFRSSGAAGVWTKDKSKHWSKPDVARKTNYIRDNQWNPAKIRGAKLDGHGGGNTGNVSNQRPQDPAPNVNPAPTQAPVAVPGNQGQEEQLRPGDFRDWNKRKKARGLRREGVRHPQDSQEPPASPDSTTSSQDAGASQAEGMEGVKNPGAVEQGQGQEEVDAQPRGRPGDFKARQKDRFQRTLKTKKMEKGRSHKEDGEKEGDSSKDSKPSDDSTSESTDEDKGGKDDSDKRRKGRPGFGGHKSDEDK